MEKISRILPPSKRVTTVDTGESPPVRPGAPDQGRTRKVSVPSALFDIDNYQSKMSESAGDRVSLSGNARERLKSASERDPKKLEEVVGYKDPIQKSKIKAVNDLSQKFFSKLQEDYDQAYEPRSLEE